MTRLHLVDGTYELYRAHFAPRPDHRAPAGWDAKATVGVVASLLALLNEADEAVTHIAVAFDNPIRSFRNDLFAPYKSDEGVPPELRAQFDTVEAAVRALGVTVWSMGEWEADDAMATGARLFADQVDQVRIMTPDKDLAQCLRGERVVQIDRRQRKLTDEATFRATRGYGPGSVPDFLALTGDTADGIPGLDGFGEKSAGLLIGAYEHIEAIPDRADHWTVKPRGALQPGGDAGRPPRGGAVLPEAGDADRYGAADRDAGRPALPGHAARTLRRLVRRGGRHDGPHRAPRLARLSFFSRAATRRSAPTTRSRRC